MDKSYSLSWKIGLRVYQDVERGLVGIKVENRKGSASAPQNLIAFPSHFLAGSQI
jgi:hypothetical protein